MKLQPREYQEKIIQSIKENGNTLVVLPTGLGKTLIALAMMEKTPGKCLFLTPTKPLARQHSNTVKEVLGAIDGGSALVTGENTPKKRAALYKNHIISSTPQTIRNDMKKGIFPSDETSLVVFDEAHRAVGDYAYVRIADGLSETTKIIGLTASPGGDRAKIKKVLDNLRITNIEVRTNSDPDVTPYIKKMKQEWIPVSLTGPYLEAKDILASYAKKQATLLKNMGIRPCLSSKKAFLELRSRIMRIKHPMKYRVIYLYSCLLHILHLQELLETQGKIPVVKYLEKLRTSDSKSATAVSKSTEISRVLSLLEKASEHPKMGKLFSIMDKLRGKKLIIFVQYRDQIEEITAEMDRQGFSARPFMGKRKNFNKRMQEETMDSFRKGEFDTLVASSIGEEGLDIPEVDAVVFYEPIPSEIRSIQRRGRAGRMKEGAVYVLMTRKTRDEYYYWASRKREKKMNEVLLSFRDKFRMQSTKPPNPQKKETGQNTLNKFL
ncbi:DEAD/DEAH box helicase [Candidatus Micrarchaeota archaeon]|nr:DEAD/DEAH box helicase [Candidatus Micrarchaeota archaeon]